MLANINPGMVFLDDRYINVENLNDFQVNKEHLFISLDFFGEKDVIRFGSIQELNKAVLKLNRAITDITHGTVYE